MKPVYVVTMYRFGERCNHSYVLGVWPKKWAAVKAAEAERMARGGTKYMPEVLEVTNDDIKDIVELKLSPAIKEGRKGKE